MNWVLSFIFFLILDLQYFLYGNFILDIFGYKKNNGLVFVTGFLSTFLVSFFVGFPCQLFYASWNIYFICVSCLFLLLDVLLIYKYQNSIKKFIKNVKEDKSLIFNKISFFCKENWLCVLFVIVFTFFSMSNQLPVYQLNYDDIYYIGKMVNFVGADHLLGENYFNGAPLETLGFDISRQVTTYELTYAYFATIFHIDIPFFARVTMVIHNYTIFVIVYKMIASHLVKNKYLAQYCILPFFIFVIPFGYLQSGITNVDHRINSYDLWQFQTAAFYGGSVVRMMAIPILFEYSIPLIKKMSVKGVSMVAIVSISLASFSMIFTQIFVLFTIAIVIVKNLYMIYLSIKKKNVKKSIFYVFLFVACILLIFSTKLLDHFSFINTEAFNSTYNNYLPFQKIWLDHDIILRWAFRICIFGILISFSFKKSLVFTFVLTLYLLIRKSYFKELLIISSVNVFFVILRSIASIQYLILFMFGCILIMVLEIICKKRVFYGIISSSFIIIVLLFFSTHVEEFKEYSYLGSGISSDGWDFKRVLDVNTKMIPNITSKIGNYFNELSGERYKFYCPAGFKTDGKVTFAEGFELGSSKIHVSARKGFPTLDEKDIVIVDSFISSNKGNAENVKDILLKADVSYVIVFNQNSKDDLCKIGGTVVLDDTQNKNPYWLIKI